MYESNVRRKYVGGNQRPDVTESSVNFPANVKAAMQVIHVPAAPDRLKNAALSRRPRRALNARRRRCDRRHIESAAPAHHHRSTGKDSPEHKHAAEQCPRARAFPEREHYPGRIQYRLNQRDERRFQRSDMLDGARVNTYGRPS